MKITPKVVDKPWGSEIWWAHAEGRYMGKTLYIKEGHRLSLQLHEKKDETIYVLQGRLKLIYGNFPKYNDLLLTVEEGLKEIYLEAGESFRVEPYTIHRFCAESQDVVLLEVSTDYPNDVVRMQDDYSRG